MKKKILFISLIFVLCIALLGGCNTIPKDALVLSPQTLSDRQMQTRRFETSDSQQMITAASAVLQDLGFVLEEAEVPLGLLVGSKTRDATSAGQVTMAFVVALLGGGVQPIDKAQTLRISMVMRQIKDTEGAEINASTVRVTFQRIIVNTAGQVSRLEQINDSAIYQDFFERLSKSVFLEAQEI